MTIARGKFISTAGEMRAAMVGLLDSQRIEFFYQDTGKRLYAVGFSGEDVTDFTFELRDVPDGSVTTGLPTP